MYFLKETADKIKTTENDILRRAMLSNNDGSFFSNPTDVYLSIWYTGLLWKRSTEHVLGGLREWNGLLDIRPADVPMILVNLKPVYLSSFIERRDQYIALESRPAGQSHEIDPYVNAGDTNEGVRFHSLEYPERLVPLIKKVEVSRDNLLVLPPVEKPPEITGVEMDKTLDKAKEYVTPLSRGKISACPAHIRVKKDAVRKPPPMSGKYRQDVKGVGYCLSFLR